MASSTYYERNREACILRVKKYKQAQAEKSKNKKYLFRISDDVFTWTAPCERKCPVCGQYRSSHRRNKCFSSFVEKEMGKSREEFLKMLVKVNIH